METRDVNGPPSPRSSSANCRTSCASTWPEAPCPKPDPAGAAQTPPPHPPSHEFVFDKTPRDVKAFLDRFVIQQEEAKKVLSVALCDHYHHVRMAQEGKDPLNYAKQNIILIGPTGVGKTYLIRKAADLIGVPFVKGDATKFSEPATSAATSKTSSANSSAAPTAI